MIPERSRQERIDAIFEQELHAKPRDENFKPKLANGGYTGNPERIFMVVNDEYRPFTISTTFDKLSLSIENTTLSIKSFGESIEKLGKWNDGA